MLTTKTAILHFGSAAELARALHITSAAVAQWGEHVPVGRAYQLEVLTRGKLRAVTPRKESCE